MQVERVVGWLETAPENKKAAASDALARAFLQSEMSLEDREIAEATITVLLDDPNPSVRAGLAGALCSSHKTPRHIILALADDEPWISIPVLAQSPLLLSGELIEIAAKGTEEQQQAIAGRMHLSFELTAALGEVGCFEANLTMLLNPSASISKSTFLKMAERFGDIDDMRKCLLARDDVPMSVRILLIEKYALSLLELEGDMDERELSKKSIELQEACDKATITFAAQVDDVKLYEIVQTLLETSRLNTAFLLRAICMGNISLFSYTLSILGEVPLARVERVLSDDRKKAFAAIYEKADLPIAAMGVFQEAVASWRSLLSQGHEIDPVRLPYLVTRHVLDTYSGEVTKEVDELLLLLRKICTQAARENARETVQRVSAHLEAQEQLMLEEQRILEEQISEEDVLDFAVHLADELAEDAIQQDKEIENQFDQIEPANVGLLEVDKAA